MSKFNEYMEAAKLVDPTEKLKGSQTSDFKAKKDEQILKNLFDQFQKKKYEVDLDDEYLYITNKKGYNIAFKCQNGKLSGFVQGFKQDVPISEIPADFENVKEFVDDITRTWMKEYDPHGDRW